MIIIPGFIKRIFGGGKQPAEPVYPSSPWGSEADYYDMPVTNAGVSRKLKTSTQYSKITTTTTDETYNTQRNLETRSLTFIDRGRSPEDDYWYNPVSMPTATGIEINPNLAVNCGVILAGMRVLSESVATLPLIVFKRRNKGRERAKDHPLYNLFHVGPNPEQTIIEWLEYMMHRLVIWGRAYNQLVRTRGNKILEIWPLESSRMTRYRESPTDPIKYKYRQNNGEYRFFDKEEIFEIVGPMGGQSLITLAKESIGLAIATERYGAKFFANNARPGGVLEHPDSVTKDEYERIKKSANENYGGVDNAHKLMILERGMTFRAIGIPPELAQFLETRKYQRSEIAGWLRIPPHMIGDLEHATYTNIEHQSLEFVIHTIRPWCVRIEKAIQNTFFPGTDQYYAEFLLDALLRGDAKTRAEFYSTMCNIGGMNRNEVRERENMNPMSGEQGNIYTVQVNMCNLEQLVKIDDDELTDQELSEVPLNEATPKQSKRKMKLYRASAAERLRLRVVYKPKILEMGKRIVNNDIKELRRKIKETRHRRDIVSFKIWMKKHYVRMVTIVKAQSHGTFEAYKVAMVQALANETGEDPIDLTKWTEGYADIFAKRYCDDSQGQLNALGDFDDIEDRIDEWEEKRPGKISNRETVDLSEAAAKTFFVFYGFDIIWMTQGKACPACKELAGQKVGKDGVFVPAGGSLEMGEGETPMQVYYTIRHPQLHSGCECFLVPG